MYIAVLRWKVNRCSGAGWIQMCMHTGWTDDSHPDSW